jgi:hypothetical protein
LDENLVDLLPISWNAAHNHFGRRLAAASLVGRIISWLLWMWSGMEIAAHNVIGLKVFKNVCYPKGIIQDASG